MKDRVILHCDMNGFFASVELLSRPDLRDRPMAVCGNPENRHGIILAKNEPAKKYGVVTAETIWQARKKCPDLVLLPPHYDKYSEFCRLINGIYQQYTDQVEPFSIDESWLDVTASQKLFGTGREIADAIRNRVKKELGLTLSAGVSFNKFFAKMGSEYKKPDATTEITRDNFRELLWPLPIEEMFFVGFSTAQRLRGIGVDTIGALAETPPGVLSDLLGKQGPLLRSYALGLDESPVSLYGERSMMKSVGHGSTFRRDIASDDEILTALTALSDTVAARLRKYGLKAFGVKVDLRSPDFRDVSRQKKYPSPTNVSTEIRRRAFDIIKEMRSGTSPIRQITVTAIELTDEAGETSEQLSFFGAVPDALAERDKSLDKALGLEEAMDEIRRKFGKSAVSYARVIDNDIGIDY
ncbi:MAG: DNA polymerase IV [Firmicutes bacterium]|nr:DNA polymerase IV [Bacillota bacterium]